jgi:hypothetical protein
MNLFLYSKKKCYIYPMKLSEEEYKLLREIQQMEFPKNLSFV